MLQYRNSRRLDVCSFLSRLSSALKKTNKKKNVNKNSAAQTHGESFKPENNMSVLGFDTRKKMYFTVRNFKRPVFHKIHFTAKLVKHWNSLC